MHSRRPSVTIGIVGDELVVQDIPIPRAAENMGKLMRQLRQAGIERIVIDRGVAVSELMTAGADARRADATPESTRRRSTS